MVDGLVIAGIVILGVLAVIELLYILFGSHQSRDEPVRRAFTVLVYRPEDTAFASYLRAFLSHMRWMESMFLSRIYVVHLNVPEEQSEAVRAVCEQETYLVYCSQEEFEALLMEEKNSVEKDCILSEKGV